MEFDCVFLMYEKVDKVHVVDGAPKYLCKQWKMVRKRGREKWNAGGFCSFVRMHVSSL